MNPDPRESGSKESGSTTMVLTRFADPDPHCFWMLDPDPDPHYSEKLDPDLHKKVHGGPWTLTMEAWRLKMKRSRIRVRIKLKS